MARSASQWHELGTGTDPWLLQTKRSIHTHDDQNANDAQDSENKTFHFRFTSTNSVHSGILNKLTVGFK